MSSPSPCTSTRAAATGKAHRTAEQGMSTWGSGVVWTPHRSPVHRRNQHHADQATEDMQLRIPDRCRLPLPMRGTARKAGAGSQRSTSWFGAPARLQQGLGQGSQGVPCAARQSSLRIVRRSRHDCRSQDRAQRQSAPVLGSLELAAGLQALQQPKERAHRGRLRESDQEGRGWS